MELANDHAYDCRRWAYTGNAVTNGTEIQALALKELNTHPRVRHYFNYKVTSKTEEIERVNPETGATEKKVIRVADDVVDKTAVESKRDLYVTIYKADDVSKVWDKDYETPVIEKIYSWCEVGPYEDYLDNENKWSDKYMTFPYPSEQINKSAGKLKNPPSWQ
mgnify:CR=1 FL=1